MFINGGRDETLYLSNHFPNSAHFAVTWALRTCGPTGRLTDVRYGPTFPVKLR